MKKLYADWIAHLGAYRIYDPQNEVQTIAYEDNIEDAKQRAAEEGYELVVRRNRLFVDMDGTLAVFQPVDTLERLYEKGYFASLKPHVEVVKAIQEICTLDNNIEVFILSAFLSDSPYALPEKNEWLDKYLPGIDRSHRLFVPCGIEKSTVVPGGIRADDFLLDDYTANLIAWDPPGRGIKLLNGINHTRGTWKKDNVLHDQDTYDLVNKITDIMHGHTVHDVPVRQESELPEHCYIYLQTTDEIGIVKKGVLGYYRSHLSPAYGERVKDFVDDLNRKINVSKAQAEAMKVGSMFGWDCPAADPANYDKNGRLINDHKYRDSER